MKMFRTGVAQEIITPPHGIGMEGYFNRRPNRGCYDNLNVKVLLMEKDGVTTGIVVYDLCLLNELLFDRIRAGIAAGGFDFADELIITCTHTHTGSQFPKDDRSVLLAQYIEELVRKSVMAVRRAWKSLAPAELFAASTENNPYAFVRRYWMKNGKIVTNPGKLNPDVVGPESEFDRTVSVLAVKQEGRICAMLVNLANHGDSVSSEHLISSDWPGRMERAIQYDMGEDVPVLTVMDASGDINHFDISTDADQLNYGETLRVGRGYAAIVLGMLKRLEKIEFENLRVRNETFEIMHRVVSPSELAEAKALLASIPELKGTGKLDSQGLANGDPQVLRYFAKLTVDSAEKSTKSHFCRMTAVEFDRELVFISLPGEPFNGVSRAIKAASPFKRTFVIELSQSANGYVPMKECYANGGYETQHGVNKPAPDTAERMIQTAINLFESGKNHS